MIKNNSINDIPLRWGKVTHLVKAGESLPSLISGWSKDVEKLVTDRFGGVLEVIEEDVKKVEEDAVKVEEEVVAEVKKETVYPIGGKK